MNKRRLLLALLAVIMVLSVSIGPALAYFSTYTVAEGKKPIKVVPDTTINEDVASETLKSVTVTNAGNAPCFVRAKAFAPTGVTLGTAGGNTFAISVLTALPAIVAFPLRQGLLVLIVWLVGRLIYRDPAGRYDWPILILGLAGIILMNV